jgi:hypothetical protein
VRLQDLTAAIMKMSVFGDTAGCSLAEDDQRSTPSIIRAISEMWVNFCGATLQIIPKGCDIQVHTLRPENLQTHPSVQRVATTITGYAVSYIQTDAVACSCSVHYFEHL